MKGNLMEHRLYEDWLMDERGLNPDQKLALAAHLLVCGECDALAQLNRRLRNSGMALPAEGFTMRFQSRLLAERKKQRRYTLISLFLLVLVGFGALLWQFSAYLPVLWLTPRQAAELWFGSILQIFIVTRALEVFGRILIMAFTSMLPWQAWLLLPVVLLSGGVLWAGVARKMVRYVGVVI